MLLELPRRRAFITCLSITKLAYVPHISGLSRLWMKELAAVVTLKFVERWEERVFAGGLVADGDDVPGRHFDGFAELEFVRFASVPSFDPSCIWFEGLWPTWGILYPHISSTSSRRLVFWRRLQEHLSS